MTQNPFEALGGGEPAASTCRACSTRRSRCRSSSRAPRSGWPRRGSRAPSAGGAVTVTVNGIGELQAVDIKAGGFDGSSDDDLSDLGDLIVAAYRDAKAQADALASHGPRPARRWLASAAPAAALPAASAGYGRLRCTKASSRT